jgi:hypothetical protein
MRPRRQWAVVCGQVRDPRETLAILARTLAWRDAGLLEGVVLSTWFEEVDKAPGLAASLADAGVTVVESPPPRVPSMGNIFHQMKTLAMGLAACPPDAWVLKLRTDKVDPRAPWETLLDGSRDHAADPAVRLPTPLAHKVWVSYCQTAVPLFFGDVVFFGHAADLGRLVHFDALYDARLQGPGISAEMRFFSHPFLATCPILAEYLAHTDAFVRLRERDPAIAARARALELSSPYFLRVLATYHLILRRHFTVGFDRTDYETWCAAADVGALGASAPFDARHAARLGLAWNPRTSATVAHHDRWARALLDGRFRDDAFGAAYRRAAEEAGDPAFHRAYDPSPFAMRPERDRFVAEMARAGDVAVTLPRISPAPDGPAGGARREAAA